MWFWYLRPALKRALFWIFFSDDLKKRGMIHRVDVDENCLVLKGFSVFSDLQEPSQLIYQNINYLRNNVKLF